MDGMPHKCRRIVHRNGAPSNHTNRLVFKGRTKILEGRFFGNNISSDQYDNWAGSLFEKKINGRGFAFTFLLHTQTHPWLFKRYFRHYRHGTIGATTGNNDDLLDAHGWALLIKYSTQRTRNIGFF